jgi:hypothetical protein
MAKIVISPEIFLIKNYVVAAIKNLSAIAAILSRRQPHVGWNDHRRFNESKCFGVDL